MRILLDECLDQRLRHDLPGYKVRTVAFMGWDSLQNGALLKRAAQEFEVFITVDQNLRYQQNLTSLDLGIIVLRPRANRLSELRRLVPSILEYLPKASPGTWVLLSEKLNQ